MTRTERDIQAAVRRALIEDREQREAEESRGSAPIAGFLATLFVVFGLLCLFDYLWPGSMSFTMREDKIQLSFWGYVIFLAPPVIISFILCVAGDFDDQTNRK
jgi:hypothetical protein